MSKADKKREMTDRRKRSYQDKRDQTLTKEVETKVSRKSLLNIQEAERQAFLKLLERKKIKDFLASDACLKISDKYLLAMVQVYFHLADLDKKEYTPMNFFLALYLANDIVEDELSYKTEIFPWALGNSWIKHYRMFLQKRDKFWARLEYRACVSRRLCDEVMSYEPTHWAWQRERPAHHGGAMREYLRKKVYSPRGPGYKPKVCALCDQARSGKACSSTIGSDAQLKDPAM